MILEIIQIFLLFILPVLLVYYKIIPFKYRRQTLVTVSIITLILLIYERWSLKDLGIRLDNFIPSLIPYVIFTTLGIILLYIVAKVIKRKPIANFYSNKKYIIIIVLGSILQEFLYRGFLYPKLNAIFSSYVIIILVNAVLFTLMHTIYSNTPTTLITVFIAGLAFTGIYACYPNLILISISHIILTQITVRYNFYKEEKKTIRNPG